MAWRANESKTAIVAFKRERDAEYFGKTAESHYLNKREWPDFQNLSFEPKNVLNELSLLTIVPWEDEDALRLFCAEYYFDMILINNISESFKINGNVFHLDVPESFHVPRLENLFFDGDETMG